MCFNRVMGINTIFLSGITQLVRKKETLFEVKAKPIQANRIG